VPDFLLPDLGEGLEEAELTAWHVRAGDHVAVDQVVAEVETAKAAVEVPIPFAGTVTALHAAPGTTLPVGAPLISVAADAPDAGWPGPGAANHGGTGQVGQASGNVLVGYGTSPVPRPARGPRRHAVSATRMPVATRTPVRTGPVPVISPIVRKLARDAGIDLARIAGTGPDGLVLRRDVNQAIAALGQVPAQVRAEQLLPDGGRSRPAGSPPARPPAAGIRIPIRGTRRAAAEKLTRSRREIPEATVWVDADATGLVAARAALNAQAPQAPVSLLALLARFAVAGLRRYPELNARIEDDEIVIPAHVHLGFAAQTERGLVVPVIRDAHLMSVRELAAALGRQTAAARAGRLAPADLTGGTITVNNYGVFGVDGSAAIINHPEVAILGLGRIIDRPWVVDGQLAVRKVTELTLAFDHRVCDGGTAGGYLRYVADCVESPVLAVGDL
jgi:2-oxoisovalerate dehydrogenase E2 component (dihydrolipoyl transacylase)